MTPIPLIVLTGFLGSGKTTLLNRWLTQRDDLAVIINELGDIGIDQDLARRVGVPVSLLAGGCVCCAVQGTLRTTLRNLYMARAGGDLPPFAAVLLETTGAADPFGVTAVLEQDSWLRRRFTPRSVLTTVDTVAGESALERYPQALEQVTAADRLLLTKTDLASAAARAGLEATLARLNPTARITPADDCLATELDRDYPRRCRITGGLTAWAVSPLVGPRTAAPSSGTPSARHGLYPAGIRWPGALAYDRLHAALGNLLEAAGPALVRIKGLIAIEGLDGPLLIQGVGGQPLEMTPLPGWPGDDRGSRLVLISGGSDGGEPERWLAGFRGQVVGDP